MKKFQVLQKFIIAVGFICLTAGAVSAQTTAFNYQGKLNDAGIPANGVYLLEFSLFDAESDGKQIGASISDVTVTAADGVFTTQLDFGAEAFDGTDRFLEISVKKLPADPYTVLSPRQKINSAPYAVKSKAADEADNAARLGGVDAKEYVRSSSVDGSFINNDTAQQTADFNISGDGIIGGNVGIGGTPQANVKLDVTGNSAFRTANGNVNIGSPNSETGVTISGTNRADFRFNNSTLKLVAGLGVGPPADTNGIVITTAGNVGVGTTAPTNRLDIFGVARAFSTGSTQMIAQTTGGTNSWARLYMRTPNRSWAIGTSQNFNGDQFHLIDDTNGQLRMTVQPNGGAITFPLGNVGIGTSNPTQRLEVAGTTKTNILQITGGSDLAENFEIGGDVKPGMVVAIDPNNAGKLTLARGAYNRQVAGVISGANNLSAGMLLPDLNGAEKSMPLALSGRVWVYVDATKNAVKPGDLLTTSGTPGYAMKVTKHKIANGAIIGKAMTELRSGKGLVLVLVSLQ